MEGSAHVLKGSCKKCGECCKTLMRMSYMLRYPNPMNPYNRCNYLFEEDGRWLCEIRQAYDEGDMELIQMLPQRVRKYYLEECKDYPDPGNPAHTPPRHELLEVCGYRIV